MKKVYFKNFLKFLLFLSIGIAILGYVYVKQNAAYQADCLQKGVDPQSCNLLSKVYNDLISCNWYYLFLVLFIFFLSNVSRTIRWQMMLKSIGIKADFKPAFHSIMLAYFANLAISRVGEITRATALAKKQNLNFNKIMGTVILDRALDVISLILIFLLTLLVSSGKLMNFVKKNNNLAEKINNLISNPIIWIIVILIFVISIIILKSNRFKESTLGKKIYHFFQEIFIGMKSFKNVDKPGWFIFHSVFIWVMYFLTTWIGFKTIDATTSLGFDAALTVFTFGSLGIVIPSPGGMGTYHFLVIEALKLYGVSGSDGFSFANIIFFSIQIIGIVLFGIIAIFALNIKKKDLEYELQREDI